MERGRQSDSTGLKALHCGVSRVCVRSGQDVRERYPKYARWGSRLEAEVAEGVGWGGVRVR